LCSARLLRTLLKSFGRNSGTARVWLIEPWPVAKTSYPVQDSIEIPVQINGKLRGRVNVPATAAQADIESGREKMIRDRGTPRGQNHPQDDLRSRPIAQHRGVTNKEGVMKRIFMLLTAFVIMCAVAEKGGNSLAWTVRDGDISAPSNGPANIRITPDAHYHLADLILMICMEAFWEAP